MQFVSIFNLHLSALELDPTSSGVQDGLILLPNIPQKLQLLGNLL